MSKETVTPETNSAIQTLILAPWDKLQTLTYCKKINLCCIKMSNLWELVTAAVSIYTKLIIISCRSYFLLRTMYWFLEWEERGGEKTSMRECNINQLLPACPPLEPTARHVPHPEIKPATFRCKGQHSTNLHKSRWHSLYLGHST